MWSTILAADPPKTPLWLTIVLAVAAAVVGALLGFYLRRREYLREQRLKAYVRLMQASFRYMDVFLDTEQGWLERWDDVVRDANASWSEVLLVAPGKVVTATTELQEWCEEMADTYIAPRAAHAKRGAIGITPFHGPTVVDVFNDGQYRVERWAVSARHSIGLYRSGRLPVRKPRLVLPDS